MAILRVKYSCLCLLLLTVFSFSSRRSFAQEIKVQWLTTQKHIDDNGSKSERLTFENACYLPEYNNEIPALRIVIPGNVISFKFTPTQNESFSASELILASKATNLEPTIAHGFLYGKPMSYIYLVPIQNHSGVLSKITSLSYSYQLGTGNNTKAQSFKTTASALTSVLASGNWYKLAISSSGIYKIDYNYLKQLGINPDLINPKQLKLYGNGGGMLPQLNSDFHQDDLKENSIYVSGENDGVFNADDYILFYAQGPDTWSLNTAKNAFVHTKNLYSDKAFYYITVGDSDGKRIQTQISPSVPADQTITSFNERLFHENDLQNINSSGRNWTGEVFEFETNQSFSFSLPGILSNSSIAITSSVMARSNSVSNTSFTVKLNEINLGTQPIAAVNTSSSQAPKGQTNISTFSINSNQINNNTLTLNYNYNKGTSSASIGYLDFIEINAQRNLSLYGNSTSFRSIAATNTSTTEFSIDNTNTLTSVWNITDALSPSKVDIVQSGATSTFIDYSSSLKEYIVFSGNNFNTPSFIGKVENQDLHSIGTISMPDMIIVTHPTLQYPAEKLAQFRRSNDNLSVEVVTIDKIYNEFSSGAQDITAIRNFLKMVYDRKTSKDSLKYLLLFGACSYDYKDRIAGNTNLVPIYEARESLDPIKSYSSDDYYGFFDPTEGDWNETGSLVEHTLEIGIGRLPVRNSTEADDVTNKIIHYASSNASLGKWRNKITFIADDGDDNLHLDDAEYHVAKITTKAPSYNIKKVYLDSYIQISNPGGERSPTATADVDQSIENGSLIVNYTGHGSEQLLAQESLLSISQINSYDNFDHLPFFITATCEFGRYDNPNLRSGAEYTLINPKGGSCGIISSTRIVYAWSNKNLNSAIFDYLFNTTNGIRPKMGDVFRLTKNGSTSGINNRNYALLGDPSMTLAYPKNKIVVNSINDKPTSVTDTLRALSLVKIEGEIQDQVGASLTTYNGSINVTVYDKESTITTFGTQDGEPPVPFKERNNYIYDGTASAEGGKFKISFVVPKDISYIFDYGKISLYSKSDIGSIDASGYNNNIVIGGTDANAKSDSTQPQAKLFMNDESFVFGGLTGENPLFIAKISDENGINVSSSGIGHEITANLDNSKDIIILNDFYSPTKDSYQEGYVKYPFKALTPGNHSVKFKCWDTYNNSTERYLEFVVANDEKLALNHVLNYPNPFSTHTTFHFDHNKAGDDLDVMVQIYTISGKLIKTLETTVFRSEGHFSEISWDGKDDFGDKIGKGVYVYKVRLKSLREGAEVTKFEKLVLLN